MAVDLGDLGYMIDTAAPSASLMERGVGEAVARIRRSDCCCSHLRDRHDSCPESFPVPPVPVLALGSDGIQVDCFHHRRRSFRAGIEAGAQAED